MDQREEDPSEGRRVRRTTPLRAQFREGAVAGLSVLDIDAPMSRVALPALYRFLFDVRVQVVRVHAQAGGNRLGVQFELAEFDGAPIRPSRRRQIQEDLADFLRGMRGDVSGLHRARSSDVPEVGPA